MELPDGPEDETRRDGFLSSAPEWHSAGIGFGVGFAAIATGNLAYAGYVTMGVFAGLRHGDGLNDAIASDVRREAPYFVLGLVLGILFGVALQACPCSA